MTNATQCSQCGAILPEGVLQGLCLRCLAREARGIISGRAHAAAPVQAVLLRYFGDYELLEEIARGGMGVVWKARQVSLNRFVAVKFLLAGRFSNPEFVQRFRAEAEAAANLQHPNIVAIHEVGEHEGQLYFSMDYVEGQNLSQLVGDQPLPARRAAALLKTTAEAVRYAHQRGVIHRDLKPSNVLLDASGLPRVTDFGLAKRLPEKSEIQNPKSEIDLTLTGQVLGTPAYMPPEQAGGRKAEIGVKSDVYSLGALLYFLLTGRAPFAADSLEETLRQVHEVEPVSPRLLNPAVPRDLETICLKCLSKEPHRRYDSALTLADELRRWLDGESIHARPVSPAERLWLWARRKPALAAAVAALLVVGAAGFAGILWQWHRAEANARVAELHASNESAQRIRAQEAVTMLELQRAEDLLEKDEVVMGMAYLARLVRQQPTNRIAAQRLLASLTQRNFALPVGSPLPHDRKVCYAEFSPDGRQVATASLDLGARVWDARSGKLTAGPMLHGDGVRYAHFSPDGARLVTVSDGSQAYLWDAATGRSRGQPLRHSKRVRSARFSPNGHLVVTASDDGTARIWNARTGEPVLEPFTHRNAVRSAQFSPDGERVVTASDDQTAQVWEARTGRAVGNPCQHQCPVVRAEFSPDGKRIVTVATSYDSSSTRVWDVASGEPLTEPFFPGAQIARAQFSPDGERNLLSLHDGLARIFNARDWKPISAPMWHTTWVTSGEYGPDGQRVLTTSLDNTARLWDGETGLAVTPPLQHDDMVWGGRLSADGSFAVTASADRTARLWDVRLGGVRSQIVYHHAPVSSAGFSPDGQWIVTGSHDKSARLWNVRTGEGPALIHQHGIVAAKFSPDGRWVATIARDTAQVWDAVTGQPVMSPLRHDDVVTVIGFSPDGRWLATGTGPKGHAVHLWDLSTREPQARVIQHRSTINTVCFSPDSQRLLSADAREDQVRIHEVASGRLLAQTPAREGEVNHAEFSADGQRVLAVSADGTARILKADTLQPITGPMQHKAGIFQGHFSRDGRRVVTASRDTAAQVWDAQAGEPVGEPLRHRRAVNTAEFSPNGLLVLTASDDGTARLWDAQTGRPVAEPFQHQGGVRSAHFSPDGRRVVTASVSGRAHVWDVPPAGFFEIRNRELLADLAEVVVGKRVNANGALESVSSGLGQVRRRVADLPRDTEFSPWLEWFLAERSTRTISPYSSITIPEYSRHLMQARTLDAAREAVLLAPTNAVALAHLADMLLASPGSNSPVVVSEARFLRGRAEMLSPGARTARPPEP